MKLIASKLKRLKFIKLLFDTIAKETIPGSLTHLTTQINDNQQLVLTLEFGIAEFNELLSLNKKYYKDYDKFRYAFISEGRNNESLGLESAVKNLTSVIIKIVVDKMLSAIENNADLIDLQKYLLQYKNDTAKNDLILDDFNLNSTENLPTEESNTVISYDDNQNLNIVELDENQTDRFELINFAEETTVVTEPEIDNSISDFNEFLKQEVKNSIEILRAQLTNFNLSKLIADIKAADLYLDQGVLKVEIPNSLFTEMSLFNIVECGVEMGDSKKIIISPEILFVWLSKQDNRSKAEDDFMTELKLYTREKRVCLLTELLAVYQKYQRKGQLNLFNEEIKVKSNDSIYKSFPKIVPEIFKLNNGSYSFNTNLFREWCNQHNLLFLLDHKIGLYFKKLQDYVLFIANRLVRTDAMEIDNEKFKCQFKKDEMNLDPQFANIIRFLDSRDSFSSAEVQSLFGVDSIMSKNKAELIINGNANILETLLKAFGLIESSYTLLLKTNLNNNSTSISGKKHPRSSHEVDSGSNKSAKTNDLPSLIFSFLNSTASKQTNYVPFTPNSNTSSNPSKSMNK